MTNRQAVEAGVAGSEHGLGEGPWWQGRVQEAAPLRGPLRQRVPPGLLPPRLQPPPAGAQGQDVPHE